jgi:hypothetical protein|nr:MAG TPA: hypothetical protein [Caudoviricetes sp.]
MKKESPERRAYREKCKHFSGYSGQCYKHSVFSNGLHLNMGCDGKCERMKRYDKKQEKSKTSSPVILENDRKVK